MPQGPGRTRNRILAAGLLRARGAAGSAVGTKWLEGGDFVRERIEGGWVVTVPIPISSGP
jgi:hypothetical protein